MRRIGSIRPRKRPAHYAFASALKRSIDVSRFTRIRSHARHLHGSYGHPQYL